MLAGVYFAAGKLGLRLAIVHANASTSVPASEVPANFRVLIHGREVPPEDLPIQIAAAQGVEVRDVEEQIVFLDGRISMIVGDDGVGLPSDLDPVRTGSLGLQLVHTLVHQLRGRLEVGRAEGAQYTLTFTAGTASRTPGET